MPKGSSHIAPNGCTIERLFGPVVGEYERITGLRERNPNAI
jgi:hypothetical protein